MSERFEESDGFRTYEVWRLPDGTMHRTGGPAFKRLFDKHVEAECWIQNGEFVREDGQPTAVTHNYFYAWTTPHPSDVVRTEIWCTGPCPERPYPSGPKTRTHRADGPAMVSYFRSGGVKSELWYRDSAKHRSDGPAETTWDVDGNIVQQVWFQNGKHAKSPTGAPHREFFANGTSKRELWLAGQPSPGPSNQLHLHNENGPAYLEWFPDGSPRSVEYWVEGVMSRTDGPAAVEYYPVEAIESEADANTAVAAATTEGVAGIARCEQYRIADRFHREEGPALTFFHPNGAVAERHWWLNGHRHEHQAVAIEQFDDSGAVVGSWGWQMPTALEVPTHKLYHYQHSSSDPESDAIFHRHSNDSELGMSLRLWHRWLLGLDPAPEDAPFMDSGWITHADEPEVRSRLAYYAVGDAMADRMLAWRNWKSEEFSVDTKQATLAYLHFVRSNNETVPYRVDLFEKAAAGHFTLVDEPPEVGEGEHYLGDLDDDAGIGVPTILHESIYHASGNWSLPIYWITEPLHGIDMSAFHDYVRAEISAVVGPTGVTVGPRH